MFMSILTVSRSNPTSPQSMSFRHTSNLMTATQTYLTSCLQENKRRRYQRSILSIDKQSTQRTIHQRRLELRHRDRTRAVSVHRREPLPQLRICSRWRRICPVPTIPAARRARRGCLLVRVTAVVRRHRRVVVETATIAAAVRHVRREGLEIKVRV